MKILGKFYRTFGEYFETLLRKIFKELSEHFKKFLKKFTILKIFSECSEKNFGIFWRKFRSIPKNFQNKCFGKNLEIFWRILTKLLKKNWENSAENAELRTTKSYEEF